MGSCKSSIDRTIGQQRSVCQSNVEQYKLSYKQLIRNDIGQVFQFYHFSKIINRSSTSLVRKVIHRISKNQQACKIIPVNTKQNILLLKEVQNLKNLDHPNIVQIKENYFDKTYLYIIMEYIQGVKLSQFLLSHQNLSLDLLIRIFQQLLSTINYCHKKGIVHNLIHPQNIIIMENGKQYFLKLVDLSQGAINGSPRVSKIKFTKQYSLFKDPQVGKYISQKNDVWSCAMTFLFMLSGQKTFQKFYQNKINIIKQKVQCFDIQQQTINKIIDLFSKMLDQNLASRITIEEALKHPIFAQFRQTRPVSKHRKQQDQFLSRLVHFRVKNQLESVFWMYASLNLMNSKQKCQYMVQFNNLDKNKDGKLDRQQIKQGLINTFRLNQDQAEAYVNHIFNSIDKNNSNCLQYSEFVMATSLISQHISDEQLQKIFKQIDYNHDGYITIEQLAMITGGLEGAKFILKDQKRISQKQFKNLMKQIFQQTQKKPLTKMNQKPQSQLLIPQNK